jgi:hypothetical protein
MISTTDVLRAFLKRCLPALGWLVVIAIGHQSLILGRVLALAWSLWVLWRAPHRQRVATIFGAVVGFLIGGALRLAEVIPVSSSANAFDAGVLGAVLGYLIGGIVDAAIDLRDLERSPLEDTRDKTVQGTKARQEAIPTNESCERGDS